MIGALAGDVIGSVREFQGPCPEDFPLFVKESRATDDSVLTVAVAEVLLDGGDFTEALRRWGRRYPAAGYGARFGAWLLRDDASPYGSYGNGAAMRVSPVGWAFGSLDEVLDNARASAAVTHDHPEGIRGAEAVAAAIFVARTGGTPDEVRALLESHFYYNCSRSLAEIRDRHRMDETCAYTVSVAATVALGSTSVEDAIRKAVSLGGDADTLACIAGSIAEAMHGGVPRALADQVRSRMPDDLRAVADRFVDRFGVPVG